MRQLKGGRFMIKEIDWADIPEPTDQDMEFEKMINEIEEVQNHG